MKPSTLNLMLAVSLIVVLAIAALAHVDNARPNFEIHFGYDMAYSPAYGAYAPNTNFADGRTLQAPPAGTIPRGGGSCRSTSRRAAKMLSGQVRY